MDVGQTTSEHRPSAAPDWTGFPEQLAIRCPRCGKCAVFDEPFAFSPQSAKDEDVAGPHTHRWGGWLVTEKYPSILPWVPPAPGAAHALAGPGSVPRPGYYVMRRVGVVRCPYCHLVAAHQLHWPQDAYFQWEIRGYLLWAWSAEHSRVLLAFLGGTQRDATQYPSYTRSLLHLPKQVMTAKVRPLIIRRITETLADEGG